jgi:hypothetical protein
MGSLRHYPGQINDLIELLQNIEGSDLTLVEVGSFEGESMEIFAKSGKFKKIYCVDPWQNGYDETDTSNNMVENAEVSFDAKKTQYPFVTKIKLKSLDAVNLFDDDSIDMVYIDGDHRPESVKLDIINWVKKIKPDGYITGHDWYYENGLIQESVISCIGEPDYICLHVSMGGNGDGSWLKNKKNI